MLYIYYKDETGTYKLGEILTNHSMTIDEALDLCDIDLGKWADSQGWDGYDFDCIYLSVIDGEGSL